MKNKFFRSLYNIFQNACVIFSLSVLICIIISFSAGAGTSSQLNISALLVLALLSLWLSLSAILLKIKKLNIILRMILNFVASVLGFYVCLFNLSEAYEQKTFVFVFTVFFAIVYIVAACVVLIVRSVVNKKKSDKEDYNSVYKNTQKQ